VLTLIAPRVANSRNSLCTILPLLVFGKRVAAENDEDEDEGERLRHVEGINRAFSPWQRLRTLDPGRWPGLG
jgi:hypothetical protein